MIENPPTSLGGSTVIFGKKRLWKVHPLHEQAEKLAREVGTHPIVANILCRRGFSDPSLAKSFLSTSLKDLQSPFEYSQMSKAVTRIKSAIRDKQKILIYGDYDVDGVTGAAILYPALKKLGADVEAYIPHRIEEGYGLNLASLEKLMEKKFGVVITVDNGITSLEAVKFLNEKNADVIIVDHHTPKDAFPPAYAIVSAALPGEKGDPNLAACGLAFKVVWALTEDLAFASQYLDLVVLGTVADIAPVLGDNRILLKEGLPILAASKRPGIQALMEVARIRKNFLSYRDIAFGLGPRINASGRMGTPMNAFKLLTTENPNEARNLAQILEEGNRDRQKVEAEAYEEAAARVETDPTHRQCRVLVLESSQWHVGVLGIVAARLAERFHKPAVVLSVKSGIGKGSGRSVRGFSIYECAKRGEDLLVSFGGHAQACGLTIHEKNIGVFRERLQEATAQMEGLGAEPELWVDAEVLVKDLKVSFLRDLEKLEPHGPGNEKPVLLTRGLKLKSEPKRRGKDALQCWISDSLGESVCEVFGFRSYDKWIHENGNNTTKTFDLAYQPTLKNFNGIVSIQLELEEWKSA